MCNLNVKSAIQWLDEGEVIANPCADDNGLDSTVLGLVSPDKHRETTPNICSTL